ncbi:MAG TPA: hypothetical protein VNN76_10610 [Bacteroidota bacterium]|nr:hypothetical protein [Bacteroidota bacterium]
MKATEAVRTDIRWQRIFSEQRVLGLIGLAIVLTLHLQAMPVELKIQNFFISSAIALFAFPFVMRKIPKSPLLTSILVFSAFVFLHSVVALVADFFVTPYAEIRFLSWMRQFFALLAGVMTFLVFRAVFLRVPLQKVLFLLLIAAIPGLVLAFMNILWGAFQVQWARDIVVGVRSVLTPEGSTSALRASGFAMEPSSFAALLVILFFPVLFVRLLNHSMRLRDLLLIGLSLLAFSWTFSLTGVLLLMVFGVSGLIFGPRRPLFAQALMIIAALVIVFVVLFPNNQILRHAGVLIAGGANVSFTDRWYGLAAPFLAMFDSYSMIGYGLGGVATHFDELVPKSVQAEILAVKWKEFPNLATIIGRIFAEGGAIGLMLFLAIFWVAFRQVSILIRHAREDGSFITYATIRLSLLAVLASLFFATGSYHTPFIWLWLAMADSEYVSHRLEKS